jgi:glycosyltransferase involved in cell wall biosynthesis
MRLAFIDNLQVGGGLSRFSLLLCKALIDHDRQLQIDFFTHYDNLNRIPEVKELGSRVNVQVLNSTLPPPFAVGLLSKLSSKLGWTIKKQDPVLKEIESRVSGDYDLAYFPSAHMMPRPNLPIPIVGTIHDFNWKYFFGRQIFGTSFVETMDEEILKWMDMGATICSSFDVVDEARKLYPGAKGFPNVVHIAPVVVNTQIPEDKADAILRKLDITFPYLLFPGNFFPHKNHLNLFTAFSLLKKRKGFADYKLILTGLNSDQVGKGIAETRGVRLLTKNSDSDEYDVLGLGYQPNEVIDTLIQKAKLLVSPSIYEAICTPGMDAWNFGTPTAISDIPPFREHEKVWGIRSAFFNPMDPGNIADTLEEYLNRYSDAAEDGRISKANMAKYTWDKVAAGYLDIFKNAIPQK